jgi:hypothetical protein
VPNKWCSLISDSCRASVCLSVSHLSSSRTDSRPRADCTVTNAYGVLQLSMHNFRLLIFCRPWNKNAAPSRDFCLISYTEFNWVLFTLTFRDRVGWGRNNLDKERVVGNDLFILKLAAMQPLGRLANLTEIGPFLFCGFLFVFINMYLFILYAFNGIISSGPG